MSTKANEAYSISQLAKLCALDRATVAKRLDAVASQPGAKGAKLYSLCDALPALIAGESSEMDEAKLRKTQAEADLKELEYKREQGDVVEVKEVMNFALNLFKGVHNRIGIRFPREIAQQLYKAESPAHVTEVLQRELGRIFNELREDHKRFL
jgi:phage terminase Nu1 subunit (DNA packaging protein)